MNDILSHKHASLFSGPVKERDAEGYYDIIKRPQDLKSIKTAITAGAKLVQAAASSDTPAGSPGGAGGNVMLPAVEVSGVIVNSAQLEKELMRMFANAVMFNTGDDGVVQDAKEMYETVEKSVTTWRSSAERATGRMESEDPGVEDETPATMKRRKV
jgi:D-arabinose 1-dehydrogenase-like Zn-dependent alcohol dehydrogenase